MCVNVNVVKGSCGAWMLYTHNRQHRTKGEAAITLLVDVGNKMFYREGSNKVKNVYNANKIQQ